MRHFKRKSDHQTFQELPPTQKEALLGNHFWARGYFVNTVGINEDHIRRYVKHQETEDRKESHNEGFDLFDWSQAVVQAMPFRARL